MRAVPSNPMEHFSWDFHGNPIFMDKPVQTTVKIFLVLVLTFSLKFFKFH